MVVLFEREIDTCIPGHCGGGCGVVAVCSCGCCCEGSHGCACGDRVKGDRGEKSVEIPRSTLLPLGGMLSVSRRSSNVWLTSLCSEVKRVAVRPLLLLVTPPDPPRGDMRPREGRRGLDAPDADRGVMAPLRNDEAGCDGIFVGSLVKVIVVAFLFLLQQRRGATRHCIFFGACLFVPHVCFFVSLLELGSLGPKLIREGSMQREHLMCVRFGECDGGPKLALELVLPCFEVAELVALLAGAPKEPQSLACAGPRSGS